jgi:hypothetical protein
VTVRFYTRHAAACVSIRAVEDQGGQRLALDVLATSRRAPTRLAPTFRCWARASSPVRFRPSSYSPLAAFRPWPAGRLRQRSIIAGYFESRLILRTKVRGWREMSAVLAQARQSRVRCRNLMTPLGCAAECQVCTANPGPSCVVYPSLERWHSHSCPPQPDAARCRTRLQTASPRPPLDASNVESTTDRLDARAGTIGALRAWRNGSRAGFRCPCSKERGGSNPPARTILIPCVETSSPILLALTSANTAAHPIMVAKLSTSASRTIDSADCDQQI